MPSIHGALVNIGLGRETTRGTAVAASRWVAVSEMSFNDKAEYFKQTAPYGRIEENMDGMVGKLWGEGSFTFPVHADSFGFILGATMGAFPTPTSLGLGAFSHTFIPSQSAEHATLSIHRRDANEQLRFARSSVSSLELKYELGKYFESTVEFMSQLGTTTTGSPTYTAEHKFRPQDMTVRLATTFAGLSSGTLISVEQASFKIEKNIESYQVIGSTSLADIYQGRFSFSGSMVLIWDNTTYKTLYTAGTKQAIRLSIVNASAIVGTGSTNPSMIVDIAPSLIEEWGIEHTNDGVLKQTIGFTGLTDLTNSVAITLTNATSSY